MKVKIPVEVDLNGIDGIVDEIKRLQTYKLFEGDDMVLVSLDDVAEILVNHIEAKRKSEPQWVRGRWVKENIVLASNPPQYQWHCSECGTPLYGYSAKILTNFCPHCGADMREKE